jgi:hypothetical protein
LNKLNEVERFVRTVVLHDEISMELEPLSYIPDDDTVSFKDGVRQVLVAIGPGLTDYDFFIDTIGIKRPDITDIKLSQSLIKIVRKYSNAEEGNVYFDAHIDYVKHSALLAGKFGSNIISTSSEYPKKLFENLDQDWRQLARDVDAGKLRFIVPPILSIVLTRCARRDAIPYVLKDLRNEWADARKKVWQLIDKLKTARTIEEWQNTRQELEKASLLMSPAQNIGTSPLRILWDLTVGSLTGATIASVSGGHPEIGAITGLIGKTFQSGSSLISEFGPTLFRRGAFDLANRVHRESLSVEYDSLSRLLTNAERVKLGLT